VQWERVNLIDISCDWSNTENSPNTLTLMNFQLLKTTTSMKKYLSIVYVLLTCISVTNAQLYLTDSLEKLLREPQSDSLKSGRLITLAMYTEPYDTAGAIARYKEAREFATKKNLPLYIARAYRYECGMYSILGNTQKQVENLQAAIAILSPFKDLKSRNELALCHMNLGNYYKDNNDSKNAVNSYLTSIKLLEEINSQPLVSSLLSLANLYELMQEPKESKIYLDKAIIAAKKGKTSRDILLSYLYLSKYYGYINESRLAKQYADSSEPYFSKNEDFSVSQTFYLIKATAFLNLLLYDSAALYYEKGRVNAIEHSSEFGTMEPVLKTGFIRLQQKRFTDAQYGLTKALEIAKKYNALEFQRRAHELLATLYAQTGNYKEAYNNNISFNRLNDSLYGIDKKNYAKELETKYETEKKVTDLERMKAENTIQRLLIKQKNILNYLMLGSFSTLLIISILSLRAYKQKQLLQQQQIKQLQSEKLLLATESILKGQENERSRMAQDLHDGLGGMLSGVKLTLGAMKGNVLLSEENARLFKKAFEQLDSSIGEMRRVAHNMMPEALVKLGLQQALQDYCESISQTQAMTINCEFHGLEQRLQNSTEIIVYRIVQELVNNIIKHANASTVLVQLMRNGHLLDITVEDNGIGFNKTYDSLKRGAGLHNVKSRVDYLNGQLDIQSASGAGTSVHIECSI
jgi:two-component system, NarL family, sensor kinase